MKEIRYIIRDPLGMHARPCGSLVKEASRFDSDISIRLGDRRGDCKRLMSVMKLCGKQGDTAVIEIEGADEDRAYNCLTDFLAESGI